MYRKHLLAFDGSPDGDEALAQVQRVDARRRAKSGMAIPPTRSICEGNERRLDRFSAIATRGRSHAG